MPGRGRRQALGHRQRREDGRIAGAPGEHHVGARFAGPRVGLRPHHAHDVARPVDDLLADVGGRLQRLDLALPQLALDVLLILFGVDERQAEVEPLIPGRFLEHLGGPCQIGVGAGGARGADEEGYALGPRRPQHETEFVLHRLTGEHALAASQRVRPAVRRSGVAPDDVRLPLHGPGHGKLQKPGAEHPRGRVDPCLIHRVPPGCPGASRPSAGPRPSPPAPYAAAMMRTATERRAGIVPSAACYERHRGQRRPFTLCYVEALPDERGLHAVPFLERAEAHFARQGGLGGAVGHRQWQLLVSRVFTHTLGADNLRMKAIRQYWPQTNGKTEASRSSSRWSSTCREQLGCERSDRR